MDWEALGYPRRSHQMGRQKVNQGYNHEKAYTTHHLHGSLITSLALGIGTVLASPKPAPAPQPSALHPDFALLDKDGENVLTSGEAVSTMQTCGQCHHTEFIQSHAFHSDLGLSYYQNTTDFDASPGTFGKWDPLTYRYLSQTGDERLDLSTAEWLMLNGNRVVGGGPAEISRDGQPLESLSPSAKNYETSHPGRKREHRSMGLEASGTMEMNCFLCHLETPTPEARTSFIRSGAFGNANTATLLGLDIVDYDVSTDTWTWIPSAFNELSELRSEVVRIQDPTNENCAACHGEIHEGEAPLVYDACNTDYIQTATTGQVVAPQKISASGVNLSGKNELNRSWDIHAERQLGCTDCHHALNNPAHAYQIPGDNPDHLVYDPRTLEINEYLERPDHNFARGVSAQYNADPETESTISRCETCHDTSKSHADWLPYNDRHMQVLACETCHIPQMYAPPTPAWTGPSSAPMGPPVLNAAASMAQTPSQTWSQASSPF
jgi:hypothetical protein